MQINITKETRNSSLLRGIKGNNMCGEPGTTTNNVAQQGTNSNMSVDHSQEP